MKRIGFFVLSLIMSTPAIFAQEGAVITVDEKVHDFGKVAEEADKVSHEFVVKNTGDAPLVINRVTASCGCTTPDWTKSPIAPGATGIVKATYGAKGRPGPFTKTITVYSNAKDGGVSVLTIKGEVIPKAQTPEASYPVEMGDLRLKKAALSYNSLKINEVRNQKIEVYNQGTSPVSLTFANVPKYITVSTSAETIPSKSAGEITVSYDGAKVKRHGTVNNKFEVLVNGKTSANNLIDISSTLVDDFSTLSAEDKSNAPAINVAFNALIFEKINTEKSKDLVVKNTGKKELVIYNVTASDDFISIPDAKRTIKPGASYTYKISIDPKKVTAKKSAQIELATNDPQNPIKKVRITANPG